MIVLTVLTADSRRCKSVAANSRRRMRNAISPIRLNRDRNMSLGRTDKDVRRPELERGCASNITIKLTGLNRMSWHSGQRK